MGRLSPSWEKLSRDTALFEPAWGLSPDPGYQKVYEGAFDLTHSSHPWDCGPEVCCQAPSASSMTLTDHEASRGLGDRVTVARGEINELIILQRCCMCLYVCVLSLLDSLPSRACGAESPSSRAAMPLFVLSHSGHVTRVGPEPHLYYPESPLMVSRVRPTLEWILEILFNTQSDTGKGQA